MKVYYLEKGKLKQCSSLSLESRICITFDDTIRSTSNNSPNFDHDEYIELLETIFENTSYIQFLYALDKQWIKINPTKKAKELLSDIKRHFKLTYEGQHEDDALHMYTLEPIISEHMFKNKVYEIHSVINDILYDAEKGCCTWKEAIEQMKNELG